MVGVVVREGKANAATNKSERHNGDDNQTFHLLCAP